jgi:hypothetical protein
VIAGLTWVQFLQGVVAIVGLLTIVYKLGRIGQKIDTMSDGIGKLTGKLEKHLDWHLDRADRAVDNGNQVPLPQQHVREAVAGSVEPAPAPRREQDSLPYLNIPRRQFP